MNEPFKAQFENAIPFDGFVLERIGLKHLGELDRIGDQDRARLGAYCEWIGVRTKEDLEERVRKVASEWDSCTAFEYGIFLGTSSTYCGGIQVHALSFQDKRCELGYWVLSSFEGKGLVKSAVLALEPMLFAQGINRIEIRCSALNPRSIEVPKRCGYKLDGTLRDFRFEEGVFRDTFIFSKLRRDVSS